MPLFGICGGIQILNVACGGTLHQDIASCTGSTIQHKTVQTESRPSHSIDIVPGSRLHGIVGAERIRVVSSTDYGRAVWVDVADHGGRSIRIRAEDIRLALIRTKTPAARGLYSMNCRIRDLGDKFEFYDGRGFGHGVGLCQWGAQGKAAAGWSAERILGFYYPGARFYRAY